MKFLQIFFSKDPVYIVVVQISKPVILNMVSKVFIMVSMGTVRGNVLMNSVLSLKLLFRKATSCLISMSIKLLR